jgi:predicted RNase H-like HicB family nuclease
VAKQFILSEYVQRAMEEAVYDKLDDGTYSARIPRCPGVIAFAGSLSACEEELRSTLEEWILLGLKLRHPLPVIGSIDLNKEPAREPVDSL